MKFILPRFIGTLLFDLVDQIQLVYNFFCSLDKMQRLIKEKMLREAPEGGVFFEFSGQNCDGPCEGWDPNDNRCQCGNRRVDWALNHDETDVYPQAY